MMRAKCWLVAVGVALVLVTAVEAKTMAWYHFDEGAVGASATTSLVISNAVDATKLQGTPGLVGTKDTAYLPTFVDEFASYTYLVDPVEHTTNANHRALSFISGDTTDSTGKVLPARLGGWVKVASDASLSLTTFTVEFFVRTTKGTEQWVAKRNGSGAGSFTYSICNNNGKPYVNFYTEKNGEISLDEKSGSGRACSGLCGGYPTRQYALCVLRRNLQDHRQVSAHGCDRAAVHDS